VNSEPDPYYRPTEKFLQQQRADRLWEEKVARDIRNAQKRQFRQDPHPERDSSTSISVSSKNIHMKTFLLILLFLGAVFFFAGNQVVTVGDVVVVLAIWAFCEYRTDREKNLKAVALRKRMDAIRDALYRDGHCDLGDDDKYVLDIIQSGRENEYLHPTWLTKEEDEKRKRLMAAASDMSLTEEQENRLARNCANCRTHFLCRENCTMTFFESASTVYIWRVTC